MNKRTIVRWLLSRTADWNEEIHNALEQQVQTGYREMFPHAEHVDAELIKRMREFYSQRMLITASLLVSAASVLVALVALIVSIISLLAA